MGNARLEVGQSYRLVREYEVRDDQTGTLKQILRRGTVVKVKKIQPEEDYCWLEDLLMPISIAAFRQHVVPV